MLLHLQWLLIIQLSFVIISKLHLENTKVMECWGQPQYAWPRALHM
jgi:hypothetical protein